MITTKTSSVPLLRLLLLVAVLSTVIQAQDPAKAPATTPAPDQATVGDGPARTISLEDVPVQAEAIKADLDALVPDAGVREVAGVAAALDDLLYEVEETLSRARVALVTRPSLRALQAVEDQVGHMQDRLAPYADTLDRQLTGLGSTLQHLDAESATWAAAAELARSTDAVESTSTRIASVQEEIDAARKKITDARERVLVLRDKLVDPSGALEQSKLQLQAALDARLRGAFRADRPPLWSAELLDNLRRDWAASDLWQNWRLPEGEESLVADLRGLGMHLALLGVLVASLYSLRAFSRKRSAQSVAVDGVTKDATTVFEMPWALALLIVCLVVTRQQATSTVVAGVIAATVGAVAAFRICRRFVVPALVPLLWELLALFLIDRARDTIVMKPSVDRVVFLGEMVAALLFLLVLLRPHRLARIPASLQRPIMRLIMRVAAAFLGVAILAAAGGWVDLASMVGNGVLRSGYLAWFAFVLYRVVHALTGFALVLWPMRLLHAVSGHRALVDRQIARVLIVLTAGSWLSMALWQVGLLSAALDGSRRVLDAGLTVGDFSLSVGDILAFGLTVWLSFALARLLAFILQEDVFTRVKAGRGVPYAVAGLVRYTLIFLGFLVGLSAAGVELGKLAVILGGLGVGIGFGLQNVVNNFVSGLILLFERPIQVGDSVELPDTRGTMKHIGIRDSIIRTYDGADVIVPNGVLISGKVTNWTFSDALRRLEIDVGVAYGTPAERVIELLLGVAKANPHVRTTPAPEALFLEFGDSSLAFRLRVWCEVPNLGLPITSALNVAIQEALAEAGINVPFPQRDLHVLSVSPEAAPGLGTRPGTS